MINKQELKKIMQRYWLLSVLQAFGVYNKYAEPFANYVEDLAAKHQKVDNIYPARFMTLREFANSF